MEIIILLVTVVLMIFMSRDLYAHKKDFRKTQHPKDRQA